MNEQDLQKEYLKLVNHSSFDKLELELQQPNIFSILSIENMEIRHSNFLGWLLNPRENHGLGDYFIKRLLRRIFEDPKAKKLQDLMPVHAEGLNYQKVIIKREWRHIDLLIQFPNLVICIENKVWANDNGKQLSEYRAVVEKEFGGRE